MSRTRVSVFKRIWMDNKITTNYNDETRNEKNINLRGPGQYVVGMRDH